MTEFVSSRVTSVIMDYSLHLSELDRLTYLYSNSEAKGGICLCSLQLLGLSLQVQFIHTDECLTFSVNSPSFIL